jgi:hypothetical protein
MKFQRCFFSVAACAITLIGLSTTANATITGLGCTIAGTTAGQSAPITPTNLGNFAAQCAAAAVGGSITATFSFAPPTDNINITDPAGGSVTPGGFLALNAPPIPCTSLTGTGCTGVSTAGNAGTAAGAVSTWYLFQYTLGTAVNQVVPITHDDGISVFINGVLVSPAAAAGPTTPATTNVNFVGSAGQVVDLVYDECCQLPARLLANLPGEAVPGVPEPTSIVLFGTLVLGSVALRRRRMKRG